MKLCKSEFRTLSLLEAEESDKYNRKKGKIPPKSVLHTKYLVFVCINAMLEGRTNEDVHRAVIVWLDTKILRQRIMKAHSLFLNCVCTGTSNLSSGGELSEQEMQTALATCVEEDLEELFQEA